ncbi:exported hypothetical protein [Streptomyces misionensis JCM 4497]
MCRAPGTPSRRRTSAGRAPSTPSTCPAPPPTGPGPPSSSSGSSRAGSSRTRPADGLYPERVRFATETAENESLSGGAWPIGATERVGPVRHDGPHGDRGRRLPGDRRPLPPGGAYRARWHGRRVAGERSAAGPAGRGQGTPRGRLAPRGRRPAPPRPHPPGGPRGRPTAAPAHHRRARRGRAGRTPVLGHGVDRRLLARRPDRPARPGDPGGGRPHRDRPARRPAHRARGRGAAPGHQTRERADRDRHRPGRPHRLRHRPGLGRHHAHRDRLLRRLARVHRPGADVRGAHRPGVRPVVAGRAAVHGAQRRVAVPARLARRHPARRGHRGDPPARPGRAAAARRPGPAGARPGPPARRAGRRADAARVSGDRAHPEHPGGGGRAARAPARDGPDAEDRARAGAHGPARRARPAARRARGRHRAGARAVVDTRAAGGGAARRRAGGCGRLGRDPAARPARGRGRRQPGRYGDAPVDRSRHEPCPVALGRTERDPLRAGPHRHRHHRSARCTLRLPHGPGPGRLLARRAAGVHPQPAGRAGVLPLAGGDVPPRRQGLRSPARRPAGGDEGAGGRRNRVQPRLPRRPGHPHHARRTPRRPLGVRLERLQRGGGSAAHLRPVLGGVRPAVRRLGVGTGGEGARGTGVLRRRAGHLHARGFLNRAPDTAPWPPLRGHPATFPNGNAPTPSGGRGASTRTGRPRAGGGCCKGRRINGRWRCPRPSRAQVSSKSGCRVAGWRRGGGRPDRSASTTACRAGY